MSKLQRILTGIQATGAPHLGNLFGAILPAIERSKNSNSESFFFVADYHAIISTWDAKKIAKDTIEVAATWLAFGLDTNNTTFYRQSDVPEIMELAWILSCMAPKGLLNRAHSYKAAIAANLAKKAGDLEDIDAGINMGLYCYPILMAADILAFDTNIVPVGKDQIQHLEMARDLAQKFNSTFGQLFTLPQAHINEQTGLILGLDGRKMSKSYGNSIPIFETPNKLKKLLNSVKTDSAEANAPKETQGSLLFQLYQAFASPEKTEQMRANYANGIMWGEVKQIVFNELNEFLTEPREKFNHYINNEKELEQIFEKGAVTARKIAREGLNKARQLVGIKNYSLT